MTSLFAFCNLKRQREREREGVCVCACVRVCRNSQLSKNGMIKMIKYSTTPPRKVEEMKNLTGQLFLN